MGIKMDCLHERGGLQLNIWIDRGDGTPRLPWIDEKSSEKWGVQENSPCKSMGPAPRTFRNKYLRVMQKPLPILAETHHSALYSFVLNFVKGHEDFLYFRIFFWHFSIKSGEVAKSSCHRKRPKKNKGMDKQLLTHAFGKSPIPLKIIGPT